MGLRWDQRLGQDTIAEELPVSTTTARTWMMRSERPQRGLVPVCVEEVDVAKVEAQRLLLTSPAGFQLSGLSLGQAAQLLGQLG